MHPSLFKRVRLCMHHDRRENLGLGRRHLRRRPGATGEQLCLHYCVGERVLRAAHRRLALCLGRGVCRRIWCAERLGVHTGTKHAIGLLRFQVQRRRQVLGKPRQRRRGHLRSAVARQSLLLGHPPPDWLNRYSPSRSTAASNHPDAASTSTGLPTPSVADATGSSPALSALFSSDEPLALAHAEPSAGTSITAVLSTPIFTAALAQPTAITAAAAAAQLFGAASV
mmetsp:Transcript_41498/g.91179  ORF Transcript_41498/g.91179 Transcript_41498/m.91179 type:complete len:226 (-) Transcript_41498:615-1292(-)